MLHSLCPVSTPTQVQVCNSHACPPEWSPGPWSQVSGKGLESLDSFPLEKEGDKNMGGIFFTLRVSQLLVRLWESH